MAQAATILSKSHSLLRFLYAQPGSENSSKRCDNDMSTKANTRQFVWKIYCIWLVQIFCFDTMWLSSHIYMKVGIFDVLVFNVIKKFGTCIRLIYQEDWPNNRLDNILLKLSKNGKDQT